MWSFSLIIIDSNFKTCTHCQYTSVYSERVMQSVTDILLPLTFLWIITSLSMRPSGIKKEPGLSKFIGFIIDSLIVFPCGWCHSGNRKGRETHILFSPINLLQLWPVQCADRPVVLGLPHGLPPVIYLLSGGPRGLRRHLKVINLLLLMWRSNSFIFGHVRLLNFSLHYMEGIICAFYIHPCCHKPWPYTQCNTLKVQYHTCTQV